MTKAEKRKIARAVLAVFQNDEARWLKGNFAKHADGFACPPTSSEATCFCLGGAGYRSGVSPDNLAKALKFTNRHVMFAWNDSPKRTFEHVIRRLEKALA
jgi:hypothetical protein